MDARLSDLVSHGIIQASSHEPSEAIADRLSSSGAPLAVLVDSAGERVAVADEQRRYPLVEVWAGTTVAAIALDQTARHVIEGGSPGVVLVNQSGDPVAVVGRSALLLAFAALQPDTGTLGDTMIPGLPPATKRTVICGRCGFANRVGVLVRGRTPCQNPIPAPHPIP